MLDWAKYKSPEGVHKAITALTFIQEDLQRSLYYKLVSPFLRLEREKVKVETLLSRLYSPTS